MGDDTYGKPSWCFISEHSFSTRSDVPLDVVDLIAGETADDGEQLDLATEMIRVRERVQSREPPRSAVTTPREPPRSAMATPRGPRSTSTPRRKRTVTFESRESIVPVVSRASSAPSPPIQLLEEPPNTRRTAATSFPFPSAMAGPSSNPAPYSLTQCHRPRERSNTPNEFFNHTLYGSLRHGESVELFSRQYLGLAFTAAAAGFMLPFLEMCFHPLLSVYLNLTEQQSHATSRFLVLPGVVSFFIGMLSDFYPLWDFHRKSYMLGGWIFAYLNLMALVIIAMIDDRAGLLDDNVRTFYGGIVYVLLMMGTSLGVTVASIASLSFIVEVSQREGIHDRGSIMMKYLITREASTLGAVLVSSFVMDFDESTGRTRSVISLKVVLLIMAMVALVPIPTALFQLNEDKREIKVDSVDRLSLAHQLWNILQQQAVWRIILFICAAFFLVFFQFENAERAIRYWARVTPDASRVGQIPVHVIIVVTMLVYRKHLLNCSWIRVSAIGVAIYVTSNLVATLPVIFNGVRSPWYLLSISSIPGVTKGLVAVITTLPLIEITETGIEGATTGLVLSYDVLIRSVVSTFSEGISTSSTALVHDFSTTALSFDANHTRWQVCGFTLGKCGINLLAFLPILYLLPQQKLDAQQMRVYGGYHRPAGITIAVLFVLLVIYAGTVNILTLLRKY